MLLFAEGGGDVTRLFSQKKEDITVLRVMIYCKEH